MGRLTVQDLTGILIKKYELHKKEATAFVTAMFDIIQEGLGQDRIVKVKGLGTFKIIDVEPRESVNVNTGERVLIEGHSKISFTPDSLMKELVNKPFSQFETVVLNDGVDFSDMAPIETEAEVPEQQEPQNAPEPPAPIIQLAETHSEPAPQPEPSVAETPAEPAPQPEPAVADKVDEDEPTPIVTEEEEREAVAEEPKATEEETEEETPAYTEAEAYTYHEEQEPSAARRWLIPLAACIVGLVVGFAAGNYYAKQGTTTPQPLKQEAQKPVAKSQDTVTAKPAAVNTDATATVAVAPKDSTTKASKVKEAAVTVADEPSADIHAKYAAMDARVRTGAYKIIGTDCVVKAKAGDSVARITKRTLGPGMECYIEVYNGLKASSVLTPGQEIKIPKLVVKKKKKKAPVDQ